MTALVWSAALLVSALAAYAAWRGRRELVTWLGRDPAGFARLARAVCLGVAALLIAAALLGGLATPIELSGAGGDVVIAIDTSTSMEVTDAAPSRLRRALRTAERVVEEVDGVRMGLVVFAGEAFIALPLTNDRDALLTYIRALDGETVSVRGSELGRGLTASARAFDPRSSRPRTLLLLSDGEHNGPPFDADLAALAAMSVRVVAVGYGTPEGGAVPGQLALAEAVRSGEATVSRRDDGALRRIAAATDGVYFRELEERPTPAALLPPNEAGDAPPPEDERDPLLPWIAAAALALAAELWLSGGGRARARSRSRRALAAGATASAVVLVGASFGPSSSWLADGDAALAEGRAEEALALYREAERTLGGEARTQIRIGNALYRLARADQAASAYLEALRLVEADDAPGRFAASFNLGNTLVLQKHYEEARDAYWAALVADPTSRDAKFNYEWALERLKEEPPVPESDSNSDEQRERESQEQEPSPSSDAQGRAEPRPAQDGLDEQEAQRWLATLEEPVGEALRQQVTNEFDGKPRARPGGKTW